uniref:Uncharacterized protein n=1 Tax=Anopheles triannulatus TaxID=58253 RepID=A0A2M4B1Q4_9DIPT
MQFVQRTLSARAILVFCPFFRRGVPECPKGTRSIVSCPETETERDRERERENSCSSSITMAGQQLTNGSRPLLNGELI